MRYHVKGKQVDLTQKNFIAKGGEGSVYGKGGTIYKIYENPGDMIPEAKMDELRVLDDPRILRPKEILLDSRKRVVGFTMDWVKDTVDLCKLFTNGFRKRNNYSDPARLIESMRDVISKIHASNCLIVDGNEYNYLVDKTLSVPYFIDVNSYQTPSFPATAIMPSIRDPKSYKEGFSVYSDWFSFAIICCQLFVGIHPFRGRHPSFRKDDLIGRMKTGISIFSEDVEIPPMARDVGLIPSDYKEWFVDLFENGIRRQPPFMVGAVVVRFKVVSTKKGTDNFVIELIKEYDSDILFYGANGRVVKTEKKLHFGKMEYDNVDDVEMIFTQVFATPILVKIENKRLKLGSPVADFGALDVECTDKMIVENTLYVRNEGKLIEIAFNNMEKDRIIPSIKTVWDIMPHSSEMFSGVVYQNVMGKPYLGILIPALSSFVEMEIQELEGYKIVDAKHENRVCMVVGYKQGRYDRLVLRFGKDYKTYDCRVVEDVDYAHINFVVLDSGVAVSIDEDGVMEIFSNNIMNKEIRTVDDSEIDGTVKLCKDGKKLMFFQGNKLYRIRMK